MQLQRPKSAQENNLSPLIEELSFHDWLEQFRREWLQGEHVAIIGPTGTGKSRLAQSILDIRAYVCVLAIKREDETLERFREGSRYGHASYKVITSWPPDFPTHKVILWIKPKSLKVEDIREQARKVHDALNRMYLSGGWCIYLDEAGYLASVLGLSSAIGILLNQGRSAFISVVATMTRPSSVVARIPREALTQVRHHLVFRYTDEGEMKKCADIVGISLARMRVLQLELKLYSSKGGKNRYSDFLYIHEGQVTLVRNQTEKET